MRLIDELVELFRLYEELDDKKLDKAVKWFIREILFYLIPDWKEKDPNLAIFPKKGSKYYEAYVTIKFTKTRGIWLEFSSNPSIQYRILKIWVTAIDMGDKIDFSISVFPVERNIQKYIDVNIPRKLSFDIYVPKEELEKGVSSLKYIEPVLKEVRETIKEIYEGLEKLVKRKK